MKKNRHNVFQLKPLLAVLLLSQLVEFTQLAHAGERESLEQLRATTTSLINALVQEGVLSKQKADALLNKASQDATELAASSAENAVTNDTNSKSEPKNVRVQLVPEFVKAQMREDIKKEVMTELNYKAGERLGMPDWLDSIAWEGDMRLRYESDLFASDNLPLPNAYKTNVVRNIQIDNVTQDRERFRLRARLGANAKVNDWLSGGIRMTTGSATDPVSPNQTESAATGKYTFNLDRAFLKAKLYPWMTITGGRFANPFFHTDLVWDPDLAFDGVAASFATPNINSKMSLFGTLGAFPLEEVNKSDTNLASNKWLYGAQAGINWKLYDKVTAKFGVAYYDFENVEGISNQNNTDGRYDATAPVFRQKGNSTFDINAATDKLTNTTTKPIYALASAFKELNLTAQIDLVNFDPVHVVLTGDYVRNLAFDQQDMLNRTNISGYPKADEGYQVRLMVGMLDTFKKNDWQVWGAYKRLEADAVLDAFTDSDFHLGGTNAKGWIFGANYGIDKNAWVTARYFTASNASSFATSGQLDIDVLMLDLNAKF